MDQNYYFIDGSALLAQIRKIWNSDESYKWRRLDPLKFIQHLSFGFPDLGSANYKRAEFYFPIGEPDLSTYLIVPETTTPGLVRDIHLKYCGEKLDRSSAYEKWLETVPPQWRDRCMKSEKGVDIEICCDALRLASLGKMDRLFFLTNDRDFTPLCKTLKDFGINVSLIHLSKFTKPNARLLEECDSYDVLNHEFLKNIFEPINTPKQETSTLLQFTPETDTSAIPVETKTSEIIQNITPVHKNPV